MRYPRKLPAGGVHRSDRSWLSSRGLGLYLRTTNLPIRRLYFAPLGEKPARAVRFPVSCWSLGLLNRNGRRRCTVHAVLTGPRRPGRPTARPRPAVRYRRSRGGRPLIRCSYRAHDDLSLPGYGGTPQTGPVRATAAVAWRRIGPRAGPGRPASLTTPALRRSANGRRLLSLPAGPGPGRHAPAPGDRKT